MYTRSEIVKETFKTAMVALYFNPIAFHMSTILWACIIVPMINRTPRSIIIGASVTAVAWIGAYRIARETLLEEEGIV